MSFFVAAATAVVSHFVYSVRGGQMFVDGGGNINF